MFVRRDTVKRPLQQPYDGPYKVISCSDKHVLLDINGRKDTFSIDCLKAAYIDQSDDSPTSMVPVSFSSSPTTIPTSHTTLSPTNLRTRSGCHVTFLDHLNL